MQTRTWILVPLARMSSANARTLSALSRSSCVGGGVRGRGGSKLMHAHQASEPRQCRPCVHSTPPGTCLARMVAPGNSSSRSLHTGGQGRQGAERWTRGRCCPLGMMAHAHRACALQRHVRMRSRQPPASPGRLLCELRVAAGDDDAGAMLHAAPGGLKAQPTFAARDQHCPAPEAGDVGPRPAKDAHAACFARRRLGWIPQARGGMRKPARARRGHGWCHRARPGRTLPHA